MVFLEIEILLKTLAIKLVFFYMLRDNHKRAFRSAFHHVEDACAAAGFNGYQNALEYAFTKTVHLI